MKRMTIRILSIVLSCFIYSGIATGAEFNIKTALWKAGRSALIIEVKANRGQRLRIENAYDPSQVLARSVLPVV
jgi:hypothetical protein